MSNKSLFDKLFENVMQDDAEALGLPSSDEGMGGEGGGESFGGEEGGDEVSFTLDRATAQKLHEVLSAVLGGEEETQEEEDMGGEGEEGDGEEDGESWSEDSEDEEDEKGDESAEEKDEEKDEEKKGALKESPQSEYIKFSTEDKAASLQKKGNWVVNNAVASKVSGQGAPEKTAQTQGTAHYMPLKHKVEDAKGSQVVKSKMTKPSGEGESVFQAK